NARHGLTADVEEPSPRYVSNPRDGGALDSHPEQAWPIMKRNYYRTMGWDEDTGMPLPDTLRELDLEELIPAFDRTSATCRTSMPSPARAAAARRWSTQPGLSVHKTLAPVERTLSSLRVTMPRDTSG
ncbi:MAG: hypothetical protein E6I75_28215, partial [Chloroflexi bacterium]